MCHRPVMESTEHAPKVFDFIRDHNIPEHLAIELLANSGYTFDGKDQLSMWIAAEKDKHRPKFRFCLEGRRAIPRRRF